VAVTALELIESALSKIQILAAGETVSAEDADVCLKRLNALVESWEGEDLFAYTTQDTTFTLPANTVSRTIGPSQQIDVNRPVKILRGSFSRLNNIDYRLDPITEVEYNQITLKSNSSSVAPSVCFFDGNTPTGTVYFWPPVGTAVEVHLITPEQGGVATDLTTAYLLPPGYQRALELNLALEVAPDFSINPSPFLMGQAANAKRELKKSNSRVPQMDLAYPSDTRHSTLYAIISGG
jgi:hypothetical protein